LLWRSKAFGPSLGLEVGESVLPSDFSKCKGMSCSEKGFMEHDHLRISLFVGRKDNLVQRDKEIGFMELR